MTIALSALLKKPVKIINIRAGRKVGGLAAQHLNGNENCIFIDYYRTFSITHLMKRFPFMFHV